MFQENNKWIVSTIISAIAVLVPIILYVLSLPGKSLEYEILSRSKLIGKEFSMNDLEIKIKGESVNNVMLDTCRISNSGSKSILKDDFERSISINVPDDSKMYLARLKKKLPENLTLKYELNNNKLLIEPLLLNPKDEFEVELFSSSNVYPNINARIAGISKIKNIFPDSKQYIKRVIKFVLIFFLMVFYAKFFLLAFSKKVYLSNPLIRLSNFILSIVCCFSATILMNDLIDKSFIENNMILTVSLMMIPFIFGFLWGGKEINYYKKNVAGR